MENREAFSCPSYFLYRRGYPGVEGVEMAGCSPKKAAAMGAARLLEDVFGGVPARIGIGTGSTVAAFLDLVGEGLRSSEVVVASSRDSALRLARLGVKPVLPLAVSYPLDVYVDGADEVAPDGSLVKGRGAALLGEKILAYGSRVNVFIVGEDKLVSVLGEKKPVPVEVVPDALPLVLMAMESMRVNPKVRSGTGKDGPVVSDWGGVIVDLYTGPIRDPEALERALRAIPGVVETGLFLGLTDYVIVGRSDCTWEVMKFSRTRGVTSTH